MIAKVRLLWELAAASALLWIAGAGQTGEMRPEVCGDLADLHFRFAAEYESGRHWRAARRHRRLAEPYLAAAPPAPPTPPRPAAMVMPVPQPPVVVDARAHEARWPDDVA